MYAMYVVSKAELCQSFEPSSFLCQCTIQGHRNGSFSRGARPLVNKSQYVEAELNKKSYSGPKITTAWKSILYRSKITLYRNPWKKGVYYEFSKINILLTQQLKVLVASSIKAVLWNVRFSRILIYDYFEPIWDTCSGVPVHIRKDADRSLPLVSRVYVGLILSRYIVWISYLLHRITFYVHNWHYVIQLVRQECPKYLLVQNLIRKMQ